MRKTTAVLAVLVVLPLAALAQKPVTQTDMVELSAKIEGIDKGVRLITLRNKDGDLETIYAGPEVKRFDELKVGDTVTFRYYESLAFDIRKPGQPGSAPVSGEPAIARGTGPRPAGTISQQMAATVTIKAMDPKVPSVTVLTDDGRTLSMKVDDKKRLEGLKAGDKVEITYTQAVMISVK
jgi:Cu/Ag efflux protein CusF